MIRYSLLCGDDHAFEGWFRNFADYDAQLEAGALFCPLCGNVDVRKAPMAPAVIGRGKREEGQDLQGQDDKLRKLREHVREHFDYVGEGFAHEARAMHEGDAPERAIWGEASVADAVELIESGAPVAPLPAGAAPVPPRRLH